MLCFCHVKILRNLPLQPVECWQFFLNNFIKMSIETQNKTTTDDSSYEKFYKNKEISGGI